MEGKTIRPDDLPRPGWSFSVADVFAVYGWYLLILAIIVVYFYRKAQPSIDQYFAKKSEHEYAAKYHKDPDSVAARLAAQQAVAERLQEKYKVDAEEYQKKVEEKEARKKAEWLNKQNGTDGHKLGRGTTSLKTEYNPLMGDTSSRSFRPQRKSPCSGGGCGR